MSCQKKDGCFWIRTALGALAGYVITQQVWALWQLTHTQPSTGKPIVPPTLSGACTSEPLCLDTGESEHFTVSHTVEGGIERIIYTPKKRRFETPILMQHGMWHGAWAWGLWQELFATWGWESCAYSLPGHGCSPVQRPIARCTLDYYLEFLKAEMERMAVPPILMGHSMGGALTQWYLKYVRDDLPAAVLVAPWVSHSMFKDGALRVLAFDPLSIPLMMLSWDATPMVRNAPHGGVHFLISDRAVLSPEALRSRLGPESALVLYQHNPPFWTPPDHVATPLLWIAAEDDPLLVEPAERRSAAHYDAEYKVIPEARHNVMMEHNYRETAETIHQWLVNRGIA